jgi:hypothetical protein
MINDHEHATPAPEAPADDQLWLDWVAGGAWHWRHGGVRVPASPGPFHVKPQDLNQPPPQDHRRSGSWTST